MNRTKKIYFLAAFVMIIGCYALNKSYSLFVATEEQEAVTSKVPILESSISMPTITLAGNEECLIKQTINNTSEVPINYSLSSTGTNYEIKLVDDTTNTALGSVESSTTKDIYLYLKNTSSNDNTITFNLNKKYTTLNNDLTTNITNTYTVIGKINPYSDNTSLLSYNILNNYITSSNYTGTKEDKTYTLKEVAELFSNNTKISTSSLAVKLPDSPTKPAEEVSTSTEKVIGQAQDDYGISYYYRGNVIDNYVNFAGRCWRAVRIAGDGSVKLILEDQDSTCATSDGNWNIPTTTGGTRKDGNFGYTKHAANTLTASNGKKNSSAKNLMNYLNGGTNKDKSMATAFKNFQTGPLARYLYKLKAGDWCLNDKAYATSSNNTTALTSQEILDKQIKRISFHYDTEVRFKGKSTKEPTLKCNGTNMSKFVDNTDMYVGTLTADEIVYAGGKESAPNQDYYLINDYQKTKNLAFWSLSPAGFKLDDDYAFFVNYTYGDVSNSLVSSSGFSFRPAVSLKSSVQITGGNGTKANAYTIG